MNQGLINMPKGPGATRRVWEIADEISARIGRMARRKDVIDAYVSEGGNPNTGSTQYYYWKVARAGDDGPAGEDTVPSRIEVSQDGTLKLPRDLLLKLGLAEGGVMSATVEETGLRMVPISDAVRKVQGLLAHLKRPGESVVDEFLAERRALWGDE